MAASLFAKLKWLGVDCELAAEYAKDLVWEKRDKTFENQVYIFGKQHHRIFRLIGQVEVVITDSPLFLTPIYDRQKRQSLKKLVFEETKKCNNLNVLVTRRKDYNPNGRLHSESHAHRVDGTVRDFLVNNRIPFKTIEGTDVGAMFLKDIVLDKLNKLNESK